MTDRRETYHHMLDSLLTAGDSGQSLQAWHLPYLHEARVRVALPAVLAPDCIHVAEISFGDGKIRYKEVVDNAEADRRNDLSLLPEAKEYSSTHWKNSLLRVESSLIRQTRHSSGNCTWSVFGRQGNMLMQTEHKSDFMELARRCVVTYDD
jgi:hypothetical protein